MEKLKSYLKIRNDANSPFRRDQKLTDIEQNHSFYSFVEKIFDTIFSVKYKNKRKMRKKERK